MQTAAFTTVSCLSYKECEILKSIRKIETFSGKMAVFAPFIITIDCGIELFFLATARLYCNSVTLHNASVFL